MINTDKELIQYVIGIDVYNILEKYNCIIYGGAVRDTIADKSLSGDIDILFTKYDQYEKLYNELLKLPSNIEHQDVDIEYCSSGVKNKYVDKQTFISRKINNKWIKFDLALINPIDFKSFLSTIDIVSCSLYYNFKSEKINETQKDAKKQAKDKIIKFTKNPTVMRSVETLVHKFLKRGYKIIIEEKDYRNLQLID